MGAAMADRIFNSSRYFSEITIDDCGFREYDARWVVEPVGPYSDVQLNYRGILQLGFWLGEFLALEENGAHRSIIVGHDFRRYAENVKNALVLGLVSAGLDVHDIGLCLTPVAYFAQHELSVGACAMVTASHNPNGWTGIKMGHDYSLTFGPDHMQGFKQYTKDRGIGIDPKGQPGRYSQVAGMVERYKDSLVAAWGPRIQDLPRLRVAVETGNGTAGIVLPQVLKRLGFDVVEGNVEPDWDFPHFNPNPENIKFLQSVQGLVAREHADIGICIDGDGDRIGVVDGSGQIVFSDRIGLLIAKKIEALSGEGAFVVDVKSTSLYSRMLSSRVVWEKTGHSYIKAAVHREKAQAGFERSGHFFFTEPYGLGYDDAIVSSLVLLWILCDAKKDGVGLHDLIAEFPRSFQSPNRQPSVPDATKYEIIDEIQRRIEKAVAKTGRFAGEEVKELVTINGVRVHFADDSWLLIRASSNTPNLVILGESFDEDGARLKVFDEAIRELLADMTDVGDFEPLYTGF
jgi:phosphomannomutase/phosphoglucomutase